MEKKFYLTPSMVVVAVRPHLMNDVVSPGEPNSEPASRSTNNRSWDED